jgi:SAM-dependent methyltransferase
MDYVDGNIKELLRICPVCKSEYGEVLHSQHFSLPADYPLPSFYDIIACPKCGFIFADTSSNQKDYDLFYKEFSKYVYAEKGSEGSKREQKRLKKTASIISSVIKDKKAKILDIGCANGVLLAELKNKGFENLNGLDPSHSCVLNLKRNYHFKASVGGLFNLDSIFGSNEFDFVILSHVFEHIYDLQLAVKNISKILKDNGILYLEVPDASRYVDYPVVPYYYFDIEHINHFDERSLTNLTITNGFETIQTGKKEFQVSERKLYPAVYCFFRKMNIKKDLIPDFECRNIIKKYIKKSKESNFYPEIQRFVDSKEEIIIWGAGSYTTRLLETSDLGKCNIIAFIDSDPNKQGNMLFKTKILSPDKIKLFPNPIVIASAVYNDDILNQIKKMGITNEVILIGEKEIKI